MSYKNINQSICILFYGGKLVCECENHLSQLRSQMCGTVNVRPPESVHMRVLNDASGWPHCGLPCLQVYNRRFMDSYHYSRGGYIQQACVRHGHRFVAFRL